MRMIKQGRSFLTMLIFALLMLFVLPVGGLKVTAISSVIIQSDYASDSVTMHWSKVPGAKEYYPAIAEDRTDAENEAKRHKVVVDDSTISYTFRGLKPGTIYYVALRCKYAGTDGDAEDTAGAAIMKTIPSKVTGVTQAKWYTGTNKVYVTWDSQTAASYRYVFMNQTGKKIHEGVMVKNSLNRTVDSKKCYSFKVKAVALIGGKTYESEWSDRIYLFAQPMIKSYNYGNDFAVKIEGGALKIEWKRVKFADGGYNIYVSKKRDAGYKKVAHTGKKKSSKTVKTYRGKKFKKSGTYYVYVEGLRKSKFGKCSSGIGYVWEYKNGKVKQTYYHGKYN